MAKDSNLELALDGNLESPSRRRLLRNSSIVLLGLAGGYAPALMSNSGGIIEDKDKLNANFYNRTQGVKREYAPLNSGVNPPWPRADFKQHQARTGFKAGGLPGIDYSSDLSTEVASPAKGVVYGYNTSSVSGLVLAVYHGLGYITSCAHMINRFAERSDIIPRGAVVGSGGGSGSGMGRYSHIHFNTYGPAFTPYLKNVTLEFRPKPNYPWQFVIDGEQFAIDNSGQLPYIDKGDFVFDDIFWKKHIEASFYVDDLLKEIGTEEARSLLKRSEVEIRRDTALNVDARVRYLYELINQGKSPLSKNDNDKVKAKLVEYMSTTPALTAPIKNDATPELYKVLREKPLYTWDM